MSIAQEDLNALLTAKLLLVATLNTQLTDIIAGLIVFVVFDIGRRHLTHITKDMGGVGIFILADGAFLHIETRKAEHLLIEDTVILIVDLAHEELLGETRISRILVAVLDLIHALDEILLGNAQRLT